MSDRHTLPPYSLRMPSELRGLLEKSAKKSKRSLNAEIIARLEQTFSDDHLASRNAEYEQWLEEHPDAVPGQSMVSLLSKLRAFLSLAEESARDVERLYDEKTGEHAQVVDENGNLIKSYERKS